MVWTRSEAHGGPGGDGFSDNLTEVVRLAGFNIRHGKYVDAIQPVFVICGGKQVVGERHGGGGGEEEKVLFAEGEKILRVKGRSGKYVDQLVITTTRETYGPFGGDGGSSFDLPQLGEVGGFFGQSGKYLDRVGFFVPCPA